MILQSHYTSQLWLVGSKKTAKQRNLITFSNHVDEVLVKVAYWF